MQLRSSSASITTVFMKGVLDTAEFEFDCYLVVINCIPLVWRLFGVSISTS